MTTNFRDAFLGALASRDDDLSDVAQNTGVSIAHLKDLVETETTQTNVNDAQKIAAYFGVSLEVFLDDLDLQGPIEIVGLYNQLPDRLKRQFQVYGSKQSGSRDQSEPE